MLVATIVGELAKPVGRRHIRCPADAGHSTDDVEESKMAKAQSLQDPYLNMLRKDHVPVSIYLVNGIKLQGQIDAFDQFVVLLRNSVSQMVYKHAISTVVPSHAVRVPMIEPPDEGEE